MKKLKKKVITKYLQKVRLPVGMTLKEFNAFYAKLTAKYGDSKDIRLIERTYDYSSGGSWLVERRLETNEELAKRQKELDARIARIQAIREKYNIQRKAETLRRRAAEKARQKAMKQAQLEKKVEEVKTLVRILKASGFEVSKKVVKSATRS